MISTPLANRRWRAVLARDRGQDGRWFYAVKSTGVYCRPSCPSRRPRREAVVYFGSAAAAEKAGFRACRRCSPGGMTPAVRALRAACAYLEQHLDEPLRLAALAAAAGVSAPHLCRLFRRELGLTPRQLLAARRRERFAASGAASVTTALYEAGYGAPSRLYDRAAAPDGLTPLQLLRRGAGAEIGYTLTRSRLGWILLAATARGVCDIRLGADARRLQRELAARFAAARLERADRALAAWARAARALAAGASDHPDLPLDLRGTAFQRRVWALLRQIPRGETRTYAQVARALGRPRAARAVAAACARNPVALAIPCHRVVAARGLGGYHWGVARKRALLRRERAD
ncbi:MAG TPA: methylated-DNA--[protein]-cysteine S-methyltransferase [Terriglobales bacterium]|nr:methylated-DNA--[protein]-cysteine S-methyltransferase [Terriglobales bacterium]